MIFMRTVSLVVLLSLVAILPVQGETEKKPASLADLYQSGDLFNPKKYTAVRAAFSALFEKKHADAIRQARRYVHVEFYILQSDESTDNFFRALEEAAERGVVVRVLLDHWANRGKPFYKKTLRRLDAMGAHWHLMLPVQPLRGRWQRPDLRNHRKLLVIDGDVAYMGSQNVTDSSYNLRKNIRRGLHWVDLMVRVEGPVVASINAVFLSDWYSETDETLRDEIDLFSVTTGPGELDCQIVPSGPCSTSRMRVPMSKRSASRA